MPLGYVQLGTELDVEGGRFSRAERPAAGFNLVTPDYFATMAIPIVHGRGFTPADAAAATRVAVVNRELAEIFRDGDQAPIYQEWVGSNGVKPSPMLVAMYLVQGLSE